MKSCTRRTAQHHNGPWDNGDFTEIMHTADSRHHNGPWDNGDFTETVHTADSRHHNGPWDNRDFTATAENNAEGRRRATEPRTAPPGTAGDGSDRRFLTTHSLVAKTAP